MPVCFMLSKKGLMPHEFKPEKLVDVDNAMCAYFGETPDRERYYRMWVDIEGFALALGKSFDQMRKEFGPERLAIIDYLDKYYDAEGWRS